MNPRARRTVTILRAIVHEIRAEKITFMAGSIAYHMFVSILPLLLLVLSVVAALGNTGLEQGIIELTGAALTPGASEVLLTELRSTSTEASVLGIVLLIWGTLRIFRGLDTAFSDIYESETANPFTDQIRDGLIVLVSVAVAILVAVVLEALFLDGVSGVLGWALSRLLLVFGLAIAFLPMYYVFPDQENMQVREVLPGVAFAAVGLAVFESLFRLYAGGGSNPEGQSLLAGILVLLTWLYFSGLVILVGVAINAVTSNRSRDVDIRPLFGGIPRSDAVLEAAMAAEGVDADELADVIDRLGQELATATSVTVTVDGEEFELPPPDAVNTDSTTSPLPFINNSMGLEFRWSPDQGSK